MLRNTHTSTMGLLCTKDRLSLTASSDRFHSLVKDLSDVLGPSSGIDSADVDPADLIHLMAKYKSNDSDWSKYAFADETRNYTRNLVDEGNGKSNLLIVVWTPGKGSPIHDHADAHCVMKILSGSLEETLYHVASTTDNAEPARTPVPEATKRTTYQKDEVTYISDKIGLHKIANASENEVAVSLHLYTPPHAANFGFNLFDEKTGRCTHIKQAGFYSDRGHLVREAKDMAFEKCGF